MFLDEDDDGFEVVLERLSYIDMERYVVYVFEEVEERKELKYLLWLVDVSKYVI